MENIGVREFTFNMDELAKSSLMSKLSDYILNKTNRFIETGLDKNVSKEVFTGIVRMEVERCVLNTDIAEKFYQRSIVNKENDVIKALVSKYGLIHTIMDHYNDIWYWMYD